MDMHILTRQPEFGAGRRLLMRQTALEFRTSALLVPARIPSEAAANLLGLHGQVLSAMAREQIVACLGAPRANGSIRYWGPYILKLRADREYLAQAQEFARAYWRSRNSGEAEALGGTSWRRFAPPARLPAPDAPLALDPVVGIGAAEVLLGFAAHELRILAKKRALPVAGDTGAGYKHKRFFVSDLLDCWRDSRWIDRAERTVTDYWRAKNAPASCSATAEAPAIAA